MKYFLLFLSLYLSPSALYAFDLNQTVRSLQQTYDQTQSWQADFVQTTFVDLIGKNISKNGEIAVKKPSQLLLSYKGDSPKHYISNGEKLWIYIEGEPQVVVYKKISKILASEALTFLKGLGNLNQDFVVDLYSQDSKNTAHSMIENKNLVLLQLIPRREGMIEKIVLGVNTQKNVVEEMTLFNQSDNKSHYAFKNIRFNSIADNSRFEFKAEAGVSEIDGN